MLQSWFAALPNAAGYDCERLMREFFADGTMVCQPTEVRILGFLFLAEISRADSRGDDA